MAAPLKPWERNIPVNQRQPSFNPDQTNSFVTTPPHMAQSGGGGGVSVNNLSSNYQPPLPPRPTNYGASTPTYRGYNSFGSYGGFGGSPYYGGGMGTFGGYGGYGGYNRFGMGGEMGPDENGFIQAAEESSRQAFQSIESIVHAFGSVSMMLESTYHAVHSSFRAVLGVAEHFSRMKSHFAQIFSALAVVRTLRWLYRKLLYIIGLRSQDPNLEAIWHAAGSMPQSPAGPFTEADLKASRSSWPIVMFLAVVFGGPYLIWRLLSSLAPTVKSKTKAWVTGEGEHYAAVGVYNFQAGNQKELTFSAGQYLFLAPKNQQPNVRGWLLASNKKNTGLVPANYIKILGLRQGSPPVSNSVSKQQDGQGSGITSNMGNRSITSGISGVPHSALPAQSEAQNSSDDYHVMDVGKFQKLSMSQPTQQTAAVHELSTPTPTQPLVSQENEKSEIPGVHDNGNFAQEYASYTDSAMKGLPQTDMPNCDEDKSVDLLPTTSDAADDTKDDSQKLLEKTT